MYGEIETINSNEHYSILDQSSTDFLSHELIFGESGATVLANIPLQITYNFDDTYVKAIYFEVKDGTNVAITITVKGENNAPRTLVNIIL